MRLYRSKIIRGRSIAALVTSPLNFTLTRSRILRSQFYYLRTSHLSVKKGYVSIWVDIFKQCRECISLKLFNKWEVLSLINTGITLTCFVRKRDMRRHSEPRHITLVTPIFLISSALTFGSSSSHRYYSRRTQLSIPTLFRPLYPSPSLPFALKNVQQVYTTS